MSALGFGMHSVRCTFGFCLWSFSTLRREGRYRRTGAGTGNWGLGTGGRGDGGTGKYGRAGSRPRNGGRAGWGVGKRAYSFIVHHYQCQYRITSHRPISL